MNKTGKRMKYRNSGSYTKRMRLKKIAKETMKITQQGYYERDGVHIELPEGNYNAVIVIMFHTCEVTSSCKTMVSGFIFLTVN